MKNIIKNKLVIWMLILIITLLWGYAWVAMKDVLAYMGPSTFTAIRFALGTFFLHLHYASPYGM